MVACLNPVTKICPSLDWAVIRTKPNRERLAVCNLALRNLDVYCPRILLDPWHRRAPKGPVPLFPGYIFVRKTPELQAHTLRYCAGVQYPLVFDGTLARVESDFIECLKEMEGDRSYILHADMRRSFEPGCPVHITGGWLDRVQGVFEGYVNGCDRARVFVEFLRRRTIVELESGRLTAIA